MFLTLLLWKNLLHTESNVNDKSKNEQESMQILPHGMMQSDVEEICDLSFKVARTTISVVDAMCQRGAVKGEELTAIGNLRDQCVQVAQLCEAFESAYEE